MTPGQDPSLQIIPLWTESDARLEIVFSSKNAFELNDDAVADLWPLLNQLLEESEPKELSIRFSVVGSGTAFNRIIGGVLSSKPSIPTRIWFQESTVTSRFLLAYRGNITEFKASDAIFSGGVGIHHNGRPDCIFERCSFDGDSAISGILGRVMITGGKSTGVLTVDGEANYLSITDISVNVLQVWFYKIEPTSVRNGSHDFAIRPLDVAGHLDISRIKSTEGAVLHVQPHKFAANAHMKITNCSIAINCRGITLPERFELFIERNESEYIDLRNIVCSTSSRTTIRKQHLRGLLVSGTRLDTFYLSDVLFAQSGGHAYLPEDAGATHLPALLQEPDQFSGSPIYKICNGSSDQGAVLSSYRQLIAKFDNERDFLKSESLHFREMDLARLLYRHEQVRKFGRVGTIVAAISPHALYKVLAKYGTSYSRALFCVILLLVVVFPMAFLAIGLKGKDDGAQKNNLAYSISNTVCINPPHCFEVKREFIRDWGIAITYTLQIATLQKDESLEPVGWIGKFIKALALPIILGQLALFFVALKRHFRRQIS